MVIHQETMVVVVVGMTVMAQATRLAVAIMTPTASIDHLAVLQAAAMVAETLAIL